MSTSVSLMRDRWGQRAAIFREEARRAGFVAADVPLLQPADVFLDLSGEDIRRRLVMAAQAEGPGALCLRPEFTIPAARAVVEAGGLPAPVDLSFVGPVFRQRPGESGEFWQAGFESLGRPDAEAADADLLAATFGAVTALGASAPAIVMSDLDLVARFFDALKLDATLARRLRQAFAAGRWNEWVSPVARPQFGLSRYSGVLTALKGADPAEARAFVTDLIALAGLSAVGGRSAGEIADRFLGLSEAGAETLSAEQKSLTEAFFAIAGDPDEVAAALRDLAARAALDLGAALDRFEMRTGFMAARGLPVESVRVEMGFARSLDYYTGLVFEIRDAAKPGKPLAGGGRYDTLLSRLGCPAPLPAVGAAIWLERFAEQGDAA